MRWTGPGGGLRVDRFAHDEYLQVLADLGLAGAALVATFMVTGGRLLWRARPARSDRQERAAWAGGVAGVTAFVLHSGFDFIWQVPAIPLAVGAIVGLTVLPPAAPAAGAH